MDELIEILDKYEIFTITEALKDCKSIFDLLCIVNYLLEDILDLTIYNIGTEQEQKDFEELQKIKDKILMIKNNNKED